MLRFENISIAYGKNCVIKDVTIEVQDGTIMTIVGENGCGKSSIIKTLTGAVRKHGGTIFYNDKPIKEYKRKELAKKIAVVPQVHTAPEDITVETLVKMGRYPHQSFFKRSTPEDKEVVQKAIDAVGLTGYEDRFVETLSGGEMQRAWIAMALAQEPEILILDEPTTHLDIGYQLEILETIKSLNKNHGLTILMVLHDLNLAVKYSDQICTIKDKKVYEVKEACSALSDYMLDDIFKITGKIGVDELECCPYFVPRKRIRNKEENKK